MIDYQIKTTPTLCVLQDLLTSALTQGTFVLHNLKTAVNIAVPGWAIQFVVKVVACWVLHVQRAQTTQVNCSGSSTARCPFSCHNHSFYQCKELLWLVGITHLLLLPVVQCRCKNDDIFQCSDGFQGKCPDGQQCFAKSPFDFGNWAGGCSFAHKKKKVKPSNDPTCINGVINRGHFPAWPDTVKVCCSKKCGVCGGKSCNSRRGGASKCCIGSILASGLLCSTSPPPCIIHGINNPKINWPK